MKVDISATPCSYHEPKPRRIGEVEIRIRPDTDEDEEYLQKLIEMWEKHKRKHEAVSLEKLLRDLRLEHNASRLEADQTELLIKKTGK